MLTIKNAVALFLAIVFCSFLVSGCSPDVPDDEHTKEIKEWQKRRMEGLKRTGGWFTLAGLFWLKEGENTFGSDKSNDLVLPTII